MNEPVIIDVHIHLYPSKEEGLLAKEGYEIWEYGAKADVRFSDYSGDLDDLLKSIEDAGASKGVIVHLPEAITSLPKDIEKTPKEEAIRERLSGMGEMFKASNVWVCEVAQKHPQIVPFIGVDPWVLSTNEMEAHVREMVNQYGARGVKVHPVVQRFYMHDDRMMPIWRTCVELGLPIMAHSGPARGDERYAEPRAFVPVLEAFPQLRIVLAHMGGGAWRQLPEVATYPNAYFDVCEIIEWTGAPNAPTDLELAKLIQKVGPERVMMGSDFPWYDIDHTVERVMELPLLSKEQKEAILGANAVRILSI